jgi:hypothetical protein
VKLFVLLSVLVLFSGCEAETSRPVEQSMVLAACPTMHALVQGSAGSYELLLVDSSNQALALVHAGLADAALTGRTPTPTEAQGLRTEIIRSGYSLLYEQPASAEIRDLYGHSVAVCADQFPSHMRPLPCEAYPEETALKIVPWEEWRGEPFVTVYDGEHKSLVFRGVYLSGKDLRSLATLAEELREALA